VFKYFSLLMNAKHVQRRSMLETFNKEDILKCVLLREFAPDAVKSLDENGYMVFPIASLLQQNPKMVIKEMIETIKNFPEYKPSVQMHVLGGFAALGNPASFHNPFVRKLRINVMKEMIPVFSKVSRTFPNPSDWKLEQIPCRMLLRKKGLCPSRESWHRDESPNAKEHDKMYGGWLNLDSHIQFFSCVPGTHKGIRGHSGFASIKDKQEIKRLDGLKVSVAIPPGHILVFYEHMVHEVLSKKAKTDQRRQHFSWRITKETEQLHPNLEERLRNQAVMALKSNQIPPMYATLHWTNWRQKIVDFTEHIRPECTEIRTVKNGKDAGKSYRVVHRHMSSLREYGFPLYPDYAEEEIEILKPNRRWVIEGVTYNI